MNKIIISLFLVIVGCSFISCMVVQERTKYDETDCVTKCLATVTKCANCADNIYKCVENGDCADPGSEKCVLCAIGAVGSCLGCVGDLLGCIKQCKGNSTMIIH